MTTPSGHTTAIRAKKAIGTAVYNESGDKIGKVEDIVLDKMSNNIMYAVVGFDGFLKMGEKFHPIPWAQLDYNDDRNGYVVPYTKEDLEAAPSGSIDDLTAGDGQGYRDKAFTHYNAERYW